jgi:hypothetical protein
VKIPLKTIPVDKVPLEEFEALVYARRYEDASRSLLAILKSLRMGAEFAGHEVTEENRSRLYTRLAAAITTLLADPDMQLSQDGFDLLAVEHATLHAVFLVSAFGNADHLLRQFGTPDPADPGKLQFNGPQNLVKLLICYSLDSELDLDFEVFFRAEPQLALPAYLGMLSYNVVLSPAAHRRREQLLSLGHLFDGVELKDAMLTAARDVYMQCSYATGPRKHEIKRTLNGLLRRIIEKRVELPRLASERPRPERPTILVQLEWFHSAHAMYRCYAPSIRKLREKFRLVAICHERALDDVSKQLFDETIETEGPSEMLQDVVGHIRRIQPDIVYYPSVGMNVRCVALSTVRLAPIQIATMGHPASTRSDVIDYIVVSDRIPGHPSCYSEIVVLAHGMPPMVVPHGEEFPELKSDPNPPVLRIAVPAMASKLNAPFLEACRNIFRKAPRKIEFNFLPSKDGVLWHQLTRQIREWIPDAIVHPRLDYNEYLERLNRCHLHLSPFPFGGTNSNIDSMRLGIPIVALEGLELHSQTDAAMMVHGGLGKALIAHSPSEYEQIALGLLGSDSERGSIAEELRKTDVAALFLDHPGQTFAEDFARVFWWIYSEHENLCGRDRRFWSVEERSQCEVK